MMKTRSRSTWACRRESHRLPWKTLTRFSLVQEIADFLNRREMGDAIWKKTENKPVYVPEHLREKQQFTSVLTVTYRMVR